MILIFAEKDDYSTNEVIDWIKYYGCDFIRINTNELINPDIVIKFKNLNNFTFKLAYKSREINFNNIKSVFFRKGFLNIRTRNNLIDLKNKRLSKYLINHYRKEKIAIQDAIFNYLLLTKKCLGNPFQYDVNKIHMLLIASMCNLKIPESLITNKYQEVNNFNNNIITKPLTNIVSFMQNKKRYISYTSLVKNKINHLSYSLIQDHIEKKYELRIFFIAPDIIFSMAIFSQNSQINKIDFRHYDKKSPNRYYPFQLPKLVKNNIIKFIKISNLSTGSIDMIVNKNNDYIFLEVNPVGQYDMVCKPCNYNISKHIAKYLIYN